MISNIRTLQHSTTFYLSNSRANVSTVSWGLGKLIVKLLSKGSPEYVPFTFNLPTPPSAVLSFDSNEEKVIVTTPVLDINEGCYCVVSLLA